jgi:hypothetical protein
MVLRGRLDNVSQIFDCFINAFNQKIKVKKSGGLQEPLVTCVHIPAGDSIYRCVVKLL